MSIFVYTGKFTVHGEPVPKQSFRVIEARQGKKRGFIVGVLLTLAMIVCGVMFFMGWL